MPESLVKKIRIFNYFLILAAAVCALFLIRAALTHSLAQKPASAATENRLSSKSGSEKRITLEQYAPILEKNPFGKPMKLRPLSVQTDSAPEQPASLKDLMLLGTVVGPDHLSYAVFRDRGRTAGVTQDVFAFGERVFDYGILTKVGRYSVKLEQNGIEHTLTFPDKDEGPSPLQESAQPSEEPTTFAKKIGDREYMLDSRKVQQSLENPEQILTDARLLPNINDGRQEGFIISEVIPQGLYHSLGLRNGDILLQINGLEISNPEVAIQAMSAMRGMNRITLDIIRGGKNITLNYQIK